jgi:hypothetical protein
MSKKQMYLQQLYRIPRLAGYEALRPRQPRFSKLLPVHLISDGRSSRPLQPLCKPSHLSIHIGHCPWKEGFLFGVQSSACKTGSKKAAPLSGPSHLSEHDALC